MDAISHTIEMLTQAPLTTVSDSVESEPQQQDLIVKKEQEALTVMQTQFKKGLVTTEALNLLILMRDKLNAFDFAGAEEVYKKLNLDFWKAHKEWLLPLKHFLILCKKLSS